jgi:heterodisulfide reductase subunit C/nitrate reductase gamma subunit
MLFNLSLYVSLAICAAGLTCKIYKWLTLSIGPESVSQGPGRRMAAVLSGAARSILSPKILILIWVLIRDGLFQVRSWRHSHLAWLAHQLIFWGMILLILMHAFGDQVTASLFPDYQSTLNPYLILRDIFGLMILAGAGLAIWRRKHEPLMKRTAGRVDRVAMVLLLIMIISGFGAKALDITSYEYFDQMVEDFSGMTDDDGPELAALRSIWARDYGVVFPEGVKLAEPDEMELGVEVHQDYCAACHSKPQWAGASWSLSRLFSPVAAALNSWRADLWMFRLHFLSLFAMLALLPFTKFLHLVTSPLMLMAAAVTERKKMNPAARAFVRAFELDACTHCAACSVHCSVATALPQVETNNVLPSEKLAAMRRVASGKASHEELVWLRRGAGICTYCGRCTRLCTVGINLQDLWFALAEDLLALGYTDTYICVRDMAFEDASPSRMRERVKLTPPSKEWTGSLSSDARSFAGCFQCMTCTNSCPVVFHFKDPQKHLDLLPHQVMRALGLGLIDEALGARMTWTCLTCYRCQEACPQGVQVTEVLNELRNIAARRARARN